MNKICWNDTTALKFLTLLKSYPTIWDKNSATYKSQFERNECWRKISEVLRLPIYLLKLKYRSLTYSFQVEYKKTLKFKDYKPNFKFYSHLSFLAEGMNKAEEISDNALDEISDEDEPTDTAVEVSQEKNTPWNDRKITKFIKILEKCPLLQQIDFHRRDIDIKRNELWKNVSNKLGVEVNFLQQERKRLLHVFRNEYNKMIKNPDYKSESKYFPQLMFFADKDELLAMHEAKKKATKVNEQFIEILETVVVEAPNDDVICIESETAVPKPPAKRKLSDFSNVSFIKYWNYENTVQFINLVRARPPIWDERFAGYEFTAVRENAWVEIFKEMNVPVDVLKERFKTLNSLYRSERSAVARNPNHIIAYIYFPNLEFLPLPKVMQNANLTNQTSTNTLLVVNDLGNEADTFNMNKSRNINNSNANVFQKNWETSEALHEVLIDENTEKLTTTTKRESQRKRDEYTIFGENVANEIRQMSDYKQIQFSLKNKILNAILEAKQAAQKLAL